MSTESMNGHEPGDPDLPPAYTRWRRWLDGRSGRRSGRQGLPAAYAQWETTPPRPMQLLTPFMEQLFTVFDDRESRLKARAAASAKPTVVELKKAKDAVRESETELKELRAELERFPDRPNQDVEFWRSRLDLHNDVSDDEVRRLIPIRHREQCAELRKRVEQTRKELETRRGEALHFDATVVQLNAELEARVSRWAAYIDRRVLVHWEGITRTHPAKALLVRYTSLVPRARRGRTALESGGEDKPKELPGS